MTIYSVNSSLLCTICQHVQKSIPEGKFAGLSRYQTHIIPGRNQSSMPA